jgi:alkylhydroperoxidase family enzyme
VYVQAAKEIVNEGTLSDSTFQALEHLIGSELVVDLIVLVGYYSMIARIINSLGIELEEHS